jgi:hypothetical protein
MSQADPLGTQSGTPRAPGGSAILPPLWVGFNILIAIYGIYSAWPVTYAYDIPDSALYLIYASLAAGVVNMLWGLYLVSLAVGRSARFPHRFTIWQIVNIVWIALREVYVLVTPDFVVTLTPLAYAAVEIAIGVICIRLLRYHPGTAATYSNAGTERPPAIVSVIAALIGVIVGGALGFGAGLLGGVVISEATDMSCFEGACGYFAFLLGLAAMLAGAVAGGVFAVWRTNRRRLAPSM